ncbi:hypothetical protein Ddye_021354 [Dipteronia dyeriana]|uniref:Uncharacterized protein n=1 Tax=Dipteronia dyeriana TaxID=168575 RepID=A0AAD9U2J7_9ROSI|nr:hypothetical protein Ddye_021354 [Dipteronia dyeriana]
MQIDHFQPMLRESIDRFLSEYRHGATDFSNYSLIFSRLLQNLPDPSLDYVWFYSALTFYTTKFAVVPSSSKQVLATKDLFQLLVSSSSSCNLVKKVALLAPVLYELYHLVVENNDLKREVEGLIDGIVSYISICCGHFGVEFDQVDDGMVVGLNLTPSFVDLVHVWVVDRIGKNCDFGDELRLFLPVISGRARDGVGVGCKVGYLAGVVMCEAFFLRLFSKFGFAMLREELGKELHDCTVQMLFGFRSYYFLDILLWMLLEPVLPVTSQLGSEDEVFLQEVLHDAVVTADYSFLPHQKGFHLPCKSLKNLAVRWVLVADNAIRSARELGDQARVISYVNAFSKSCLPSVLIKWVTNQTGMGERTSRSNVSSPVSLIKWLLIVEDQGARVFDCEIAKTYANAVICKSGVQYDLRAIMSNDNNLNGNISFCNDDEGRGGDKGDGDLEMVDSVDNEFLAAPGLMKSTVTDGTRKRKEGSNIEGEIPVKFVKYHFHDKSVSEKFSPSGNDDGLSSGSEVDNPVSDEDMEDMKQ